MNGVPAIGVADHLWELVSIGLELIMFHFVAGLDASFPLGLSWTIVPRISVSDHCIIFAIAPLISSVMTILVLTFVQYQYMDKLLDLRMNVA